MSDSASRREFLRWASLSSGAGLLGLTGIGCGHTSTPDNPDSPPKACTVTGADIKGPFHQPGAPARTILAGPQESGQRIVIEGRIYGPDCASPVAQALLDVWHADANGDYHNGTEYRLRAQMTTDADGFYRFETIRPGHYPLGNSMRPAHIHFTISKPGYVPVTTQLYFADDPYLKPNDPCGTCNSGDPTLVIALTAGAEHALGVFDIILGK